MEMQELGVLLAQFNSGERDQGTKTKTKIFELLEKEDARPLDQLRSDSLCDALTASLKSDDGQFVGTAVAMIEKWILRICREEATLETVLSGVLGACPREKAKNLMDSVYKVISSFVMKPPFEFSERLWLFLMDSLGELADVDAEEEVKFNVQRLAMDVFVCAGLKTDAALEKLRNRKLTRGWQAFVGDLMAQTVSSNIVSHLSDVMKCGVWSESRMMPDELKEVFLKAVLDREVTLEVRRSCFYGLIRTLTTCRLGLFSFEVPVESLLGSFGDTIFPFEQVLTDDIPLVFRMFAKGKVADDSKWLRGFMGALAKELGGKAPERIAGIIDGIAWMMARHPDFGLQLAPSIATAIETVTVSVNCPLICANLAAIFACDKFSDPNKDKLFAMCFNRLVSEQHMKEALYLSMFTKDVYLFTQSLTDAIKQKQRFALHFLAFACYFAPEFSFQDMLINLMADKSPKSSEMVLLAMIEVLGISKTIRSQPDMLMYIHDYSRQIQSSPFLRNVLLNLITSPIHLQLDSCDLEDILPRQRDYFRFNSTIISSEFNDDDHAIVVCRNPYSMSAFRLSPVVAEDSEKRPDQANYVEEVPDEDSPFVPYKPSMQPTRKRDTFFLLASLGLFTATNQFRVTPLSDAYKDELKEYEARAGRKRFEIAMTRLSAASEDLFDTVTSTTEFNTFTSKLGNVMKKYNSNGKCASHPVPYFDTVLFRFVYVSRMHLGGIPVTDTNFENDIALLIFNETGAEIAPSEKYSKWPVVIAVSPVHPNWYTLQIVKWDCDAALPIDPTFTRAVDRDHISVEIAFMLYIYVVEHIDALYVSEADAFMERSKLFSYEAPQDGLELLAQVFASSTDATTE